jgi:hypothetical protein
VFPDDQPVVTGARDEEDDTVESTVSPFQLAAAENGLDVEQPRLRVDADGARPVEDHIPRSAVPDTSDGHFRAPCEGRCHLLPEALQQPQLGLIADGARVRVHPHTQSQTKCGAVTSELVQPECRQRGAFRATDLGLTELSDTRHVCLAEARGLTRLTELAGQVMGERARLMLPSIPRPFCGWHGQTLTSSHIAALL